MPFYELGPLSRLLTDMSVTAWTMSVVLRLAVDVFEVMTHIHDAGVVHSDIKSANYLIKLEQRQYRAVLTDFGVCRILSNATQVTGMQLNTVKGKTIAYSAPELHSERWKSLQISNADLMKLDVYAGAVVMCDLITRQISWRGQSQQVIVDAVLAGQRPTMEHVPSVNDEKLPAFKRQVEMAWH